MKQNGFYAQSGGVTAVINASACAVLETARKHGDRIGKIYAGRNGIIGALTEDMIDTSLESDEAIAALRHTPGGAFGSARYKLKGLDENRAEYERLIEVFKAHDIGYFFYNGGGDSMDTAHKVSQLGTELGFPVTCVGIPKTVDNDLPATDNCPRIRVGGEVRRRIDHGSGARCRIHGQNVDKGLHSGSHGPARWLDRGRCRTGRQGARQRTPRHSLSGDSF